MLPVKPRPFVFVDRFGHIYHTEIEIPESQFPYVEYLGAGNRNFRRRRCPEYALVVLFPVAGGLGYHIEHGIIYLETAEMHTLARKEAPEGEFPRNLFCPEQGVRRRESLIVNIPGRFVVEDDKVVDHDGAERFDGYVADKDLSVDGIFQFPGEYVDQPGLDGRIARHHRDGDENNGDNACCPSCRVLDFHC